MNCEKRWPKKKSFQMQTKNSGKRDLKEIVEKGRREKNQKSTQRTAVCTQKKNEGSHSPIPVEYEKEVWNTYKLLNRRHGPFEDQAYRFEKGEKARRKMYERRKRRKRPLKISSTGIVEGDIKSAFIAFYCVSNYLYVKCLTESVWW